MLNETLSNPTANQEASSALPASVAAINPMELLAVLLRYKFQVIGFTIVVTLIAVLITFSLTPIYQSTTTLLIQQEENKVLSIEEMYGADMKTSDYYNTQFEILKSRTIAEKVVTKLDLVNNPLFNASLREKTWRQKLFDWRSWLGVSLPKDETQTEEQARQVFNGVVNAFSAGIRIAPIKRTKIVKIHFMSSDKQLAAQASDAIAEAYIDSYLESKLELTTIAHAWMQEKMQALGNELKLAELALQDYRERENLVDVDGIMTLTNSELQSISMSYVEARQKRSQSQTILAQIKKIGKSENPDAFFNLPEVLSHSLIQSMKQQQSIAQSKVEELEKRYGPKHPKMIAALSERNAYDASIRRQVLSILAGVSQQYDADLAREKLLAAQLNEAKRRAQKTTRKQFQLLEFEREVSTKKELYNTFFRRIQETSATSGIQQVNARIVDRAYVPGTPIKPNKKMIVIAAMLLSFLVSSGLVILLYMLSNTIRSIHDVEEKLNLPVLGVLPDISKTGEYVKDASGGVGKDIDVLKAFSDEGDKAYGEAVRSIRTSLTLSALEHPRKTYMLTSTAPSEGKSSVALALAASLSQMGKTIVVGADLRRPGIIKKVGFKPGTLGLANVLSGAVNLNEVIKQHGELDVLVAGVIPPNPQELLVSGFPTVLKELEEIYDHIIIDCPPVQSVADGIVLSKSCDGLIYVVESDKVAAPVIKHAVGRLLQVGAPILGVVINKAKSSSSGYGYGTYGYYQYDYDSEK
ncbi:MAG: polysaccharide biosynthesis tyrosine autokinase [Pseudomonadales bacterium]|nr:polysaccharide biosynthesis tyrosine autokinase [Pseudomonadales bacterium]